MLCVCALCNDDEQGVTLVDGVWICNECEEFDSTFDIDAHEQAKRERIFEEQEY